MFTGVITEIGEITRVDGRERSARLTVRAPHAVADARHGDSIAVGGVCLTVVALEGETFTADVMAETLAMSTLADARTGRAVNIEQAARVGDRLGGHIVQGHVDGTATLRERTEGEAWRVLRFGLEATLAPLVARKGSIAVDGVSLTVSAVGDDWFEVSLIPETLAATTLGALTVGESVNIETDIIARHVERMLGLGAVRPQSEPAHPQSAPAHPSTEEEATR